MEPHFCDDTPVPDPLPVFARSGDSFTAPPVKSESESINSGTFHIQFAAASVDFRFDGFSPEGDRLDSGREKKFCLRNRKGTVHGKASA